MIKKCFLGWARQSLTDDEYCVFSNCSHEAYGEWHKRFDNGERDSLLAEMRMKYSGENDPGRKTRMIFLLTEEPK